MLLRNASSASAIRVTWLMCCGIGSGALAPAAWCPRGWRAVVSVAVLLRPLRRISFLRGSCRSNEITALEEKSAILSLHLCWNAALFVLLFSVTKPCPATVFPFPFCYRPFFS
jgi:hypothetical protein